MEETINSLQKVIHIYMKQTSTNTENSFMFSCQELTHAKEVEEDLLNALEESSNEVLGLKSQLHRMTQETACKDRSTYEVANE